MCKKPSYSDLETKVQELEKNIKVLIESREKYQLIADFTYDWEYWLSPKGEYLYVSPSCKKITGYSPEEFIS
ncbi:MAG: PAS domain-containing protein, partial [Bacteroidales bacterium]|nr:PAS domain-containing protein [Bacteroidales bacterium]